MRRKVAVVGAALWLAAVVALTTVVLWVDAAVDRPLQFEGDAYTLMVPRGGNLLLLTRQLEHDSLVDNHLPLQLYARCCVSGVIHAGEYRVTAGESFRVLVQRLLSGDVIQHRVLFPEGKTLREWLAIVAAHEVLASGDLPDLETLAALVNEPGVESPEGWFFPDTYNFTRGEPAIAIFRRAHERMKAVLEAAWEGRAANLPLSTPYEALILASIVERETGLPDERPDIAGVFVRRLERGIRLQTDPTVIYGLGERFDGNLTRGHLREDTPYNTYRIDGLPPTPIANPGREAIEAVMHPAPGTALYFVARGDGSHQFSDTLAEHRKAVRQYQLQRREDYRSAPARE